MLNIAIRYTCEFTENLPCESIFFLRPLKSLNPNSNKTPYTSSNVLTVDVVYRR